MFVSTLLSTCAEWTRLDWAIALAIDLTTLAWVGLLIAWVV